MHHSPDILDQRDLCLSLTQFQRSEKEHRRVYGGECVHDGGGESRVKGGAS